MKDRIVNIGKGLCRLRVRSEILRRKLAVMPEIQIAGDRAVFPSWMRENVTRLALQPRKPRTRPDAQQTTMVLGS